MKTIKAGLNIVRNQQGFFTLVLVTMALTALIGGATILAMVTTRQPVSGAMDRLDKNEATPADMDALQNAGKNMERTVRIAAGGGSFIGGGGPVPNPASPGVLFPGDKAAAGIIPRVIGRLTNRASEPVLTSNNPMPGESSGAGGRQSGSGDYNPLNDPNRPGSGQNLDNVNRLGSDFQSQQPGGTPGSGQQNQTIIPQPGRRGDGSSTTDEQGDYYNPYYYPDRGIRRGPDWQRWATDPPRERSHGHREPSGGTRSGGGSSGGGSQPGTSGECPPGCHVKRDGTGGCDCTGN
jgi:hypothetical protein